MRPPRQLPLFRIQEPGIKKPRSGTFVDNMRLPIHRWFRYSAGFSATWVESLLLERGAKGDPLTVLDPFVGSGTTLLAADWVGASSVGVEAHPFVTRVASVKLLWSTASVDAFEEYAALILDRARALTPSTLAYPTLIRRCFTNEVLTCLDKLRRAWIQNYDGSPAAELVWLAITAILRPSSHAGTAQWQYVLPNKTKKVVSEPFEAFEAQVALMADDLLTFQRHSPITYATLLEGDARDLEAIENKTIDLVITSPPYANNYDYADATRFEMSFWGEVESWADLHEAVRRFLLRSCSQHASKDKLELEKLLADAVIEPIRDELTGVCRDLAEERLEHGGKKHYHTMVAAYFTDMAKVWRSLARVCKPRAEVCFVVGDSAPYGIHVPVERWLGELALAAGFTTYRFEKLRDRNVKWDNRTHKVPLHEGRLWVGMS